MFGDFTKEEIRKLFFELADEMEKECGEWENQPDNPELRERIMETIKEKYPENFK